MSLNGIEGTWSTDMINSMGMGGQTVQATFIPNSGVACVSVFEYTLEIQAAILPSFNLPDYLCWDDGKLVFPSESMNGLMGTWDLTEIDHVDGSDPNNVLFIQGLENGSIELLGLSIYIDGAIASLINDHLK